MVFSVFALPQTRVDLARQTRNVDFREAESTKPIKSGTTLPNECATGDMFVKTDAKTTSNIFVCMETNEWAEQTGILNVEHSGVPVGTRNVANFASGAGVVTSVADEGNRITIQQSVDTAVMQTRSETQSGTTLVCRSFETSGPSHSCAMEPTLAEYATGMVLRWIPSAVISGSATLDIDMLGARPIKRSDGVSDIGAGMIVPERLYEIWYDGERFRLAGAETPIERSTTLLKGDGAGGAAAAVAGQDFIAGLTAGAGVQVSCPNGDCTISAVSLPATSALLRGDGSGGAVPASAADMPPALPPPSTLYAKGYWFPWLANSTSGANLFSTTNKTYLFQLPPVDAPMSVSALSMYLFAACGGNCYHKIGIYNSDCSALIGQTASLNLLSSGAGSGLAYSFPFISGLTLNPGVYWLAITADNAGATGAQVGFVLTGPTNLFRFLNRSSTKRMATGADSTGSGSVLELPSSCGSLTSYSGGIPAVMFEQ